MRLRRREIETSGLSFLDCICCGFGAVILLLVVVKIRQPAVLEERGAELLSTAAHLEAVLADLLGQTARAEHELRTAEGELAQRSPDLAEARAEWDRTASELEKTELTSSFLERTKRLYEHAREATPRRSAPSSLVGGIPADSEYIIFIIDTSGSMLNYNWNRAIQKIDEILDVYPRVKGIQVLNDMGRYMFSGYQGKWIPDTDSGRDVIRKFLRGWRAFSNSSPVEGITTAIQTYASRYDDISIYVLGDEFTGDSIQAVVDEVDRLNRDKRVRIHAVGFSVLDAQGNLPPTVRRFSTLMRVLCQRNGGTFVALQPR
jgi:hypothetical protein